MSNLLVRKAFELRVQTWAADQIPPLPVAYQNAPFVVPADWRYARCFVLPGQTDSRDLEGKHRDYVGVFQVTLSTALNTGFRESMDLAESLDETFSTGLPMVQDGFRVWIVSPMSPASALDDPNALVIPVSARYRAERFLP